LVEKFFPRMRFMKQSRPASPSRAKRAGGGDAVAALERAKAEGVKKKVSDGL